MTQLKMFETRAAKKAMTTDVDAPTATVSREEKTTENGPNLDEKEHPELPAPNLVSSPLANPVRLPRRWTRTIYLGSLNDLCTAAKARNVQGSEIFQLFLFVVK